jgi:hypothetical protein
MNQPAQPSEHDVVLESLPDDVLATIEIRDKFMGRLGLSRSLGLEFLVNDLQRWAPGQRLKVAFLDGNADLHRDVAEATRQITEACNIAFDFGEGGTGGFRRWSETDTEYAADIRVSFDKSGYFSLVGTDSISPNIGPANSRIGGRPNQCSLNLGGYAMQRPARWRGTVRHEFLHAIAFHHEHQNMRGPCQESFRWDDDEGYEPTQNERGAYVADRLGRRPGIYTFLAGAPNFWNRAKVDHNLRAEERPGLVPGPFDRESVMLYRFPEMFYKNPPSPCAPVGEGETLSAGDRAGLQHLYPGAGNESAAVVEKQRAMLAAMGGGESADRGLESVGSPASQHIARAAGVLRRKLQSLD